MLRKQRGVTLQQLGDAIGMSNPAISMLEKGQRSPSFEILCAIADFFGVSFDFLLGKEEMPKPSGGFVNSADGVDNFLDKELAPPYNCTPYAFLTSQLEKVKNVTEDPKNRGEWDICCLAARELVRFYSEYRKKLCYEKIDDAEDDFLALLGSSSYVGARTKIYEAIRKLVNYDRRRGSGVFRQKMAAILADAVAALLTDETDTEKCKRFDEAVNENDSQSDVL